MKDEELSCRAVRQETDIEKGAYYLAFVKRITEIGTVPELLLCLHNPHSGAKWLEDINGYDLRIENTVGSVVYRIELPEAE